MSSELFLGNNEFESVVLEKRTIVDVRAPVEFNEGCLPHSVNLPILDDDERRQVGTTYKQQGREAAMALGFAMVAGEKKESRVRAWVSALESPTSLITCWRGGLRSQISQSWAAAAGMPRLRLQGGYKQFRRYLLRETQAIVDRRSMIVVSGTTGSGKSHVLHEMQADYPIIDLERLARHRGSAFGRWAERQPSQATFENALAYDLISAAKARPFLIEDESRMIGSIVTPEVIFLRLRSSPIVIIEEGLEKRVETVYQDYVVGDGLLSDDETKSEKVAVRYRTAFRAIEKKLGGLRYSECLADFEEAERVRKSGHGGEAHRVWIRKLLEWYYDPFYRKSLEKRQPSVLFRGSRQEVLNFLRTGPPNI